MPEITGKILVVDDEVVIRDLLTEVLSEEGYTVISASNGMTALKILQQHNDFVVLFTDIMMPELDGIGLVREARRLHPSLIPIVMTAYATLESARAAVKEGAYDYVLKPFSLSEVRLAVSNAIERYRLASENTRLMAVTSLFDISERIASFRDEQALLDFVLQAALNHVGANRGSIMVVTDDGRAFDIKSSVGVPEEVAHTQVEIDNGISGLVAQTAKPLLVSDLKANPEVAMRSRRLQERSFISVPFECKDSKETTSRRVLAVLNVSRKTDGSDFTDSDLTTLSIVANHAAAALQNVRLIRDIEASHLSTIQSMALLLEARDPYTKFHSQRVRDISVALARKIGLTTQDIDTLRIGAAFHDIGKVGIPDQILNKPGRLDESEWELIRRHPLIGFEVLEPINFLQQGHLDVVRCHHERVNGSGYPDGLQDNNVSILVRIIAVADAYDAMASDRAYRAAMPIHRVVNELKACSGTDFDPRIVNQLIDMLEHGDLRHLCSS